jgi:hypothetical protein
LYTGLLLRLPVLRVILVLCDFASFVFGCSVPSSVTAASSSGLVSPRFPCPLATIELGSSTRVGWRDSEDSDTQEDGTVFVKFVSRKLDAVSKTFPSGNQDLKMRCNIKHTMKLLLESIDCVFTGDKHTMRRR